MAGDYSKFSFRPKRRVSSVAMQQGRVQLDSDWNEHGEVLDRRIRNLAQDVWGPAWVSALSTPDAFLLTASGGPDLAIGRGRLYASGFAPEVLADESPTWKNQPFLPVPDTLPTGTALAYLDIFERELTWIEAPDTLEKALHGVDTTTRRQVAWQVKLAAQPNASCRTDLNALFPPSAGRLTTSAVAVPKSDDPCILSPTGGYRGLENRLYRVQIHQPGPVGTATFKWSRDNASVASPVLAITSAGLSAEVQILRIGRDAVMRFSPGNWVELTDDHRELMGQTGDMWRVTAIDETTRTLSLTRVNAVAASAIPFGATVAELSARHTRLIRWDQSLDLLNNAIDADGLMLTGPGPIPLEDGVTVSFGTAPVGGSMRIDDHWSFEARTVDGTIRELIAAPPDGVRHVYVPLAVVNAAADGGLVVTSDCRNLVPGKGGSVPPDPQRVCECCTVCVGEGGDVLDLKEAIDWINTLDANVPARICLLPGDHQVLETLTIRHEDTIVHGCLPRAQLLLDNGSLVLAASRTGVEDLIVFGHPKLAAIQIGEVDTELQVSDMFVRSSQISLHKDIEEGFTIAVRNASQVVICNNVMLRGGLLLEGTCSAIRIESNEIIDANGNTLELRGRELTSLQNIALLRNRLVSGRGNGVEANAPVRHLLVDGNEISGNKGEHGLLDKIAGGLIFTDVEDLVVRDNLIIGNGSEVSEDCAGIRIRQGRGLVIVRNRIDANGGRSVDGNPVVGGIVIDDVSPSQSQEGDERVGFQPALVVQDNHVQAPRGQALFVQGVGDMRVQNNTLITRAGIARGQGPGDLNMHDVSSVVLIASSRQEGIASKLIEAAADSEANALAGAGPDDFLIRQVVAELVERIPGRIMVQGNQIALEHHERRDSDGPPLSAVAVLGFEDVDLSHNQVQLALDEVRYLLNALVMATTTRQVGNRFTEPGEPDEQNPLCFASLLSHGQLLNNCSQNQGTHCILAFGDAQAPFDQGNLVVVRTNLCREG